MLHADNPATTQDHQVSGNTGGYAAFEALRHAGPRRPTATAFPALGSVGDAGGTGWSVGEKLIRDAMLRRYCVVTLIVKTCLG
jgi:hypothetical protein